MMVKNYNTIYNVRFYATKTKPSKELQLSFNRPHPKLLTGFRGNHSHGKKLYDQIYPTTKVPTSFIPRYPLDWRNSGRFILTAAMARLENKRIYRHPHSLEYQSSTNCGSCCECVCAGSQFRCLCSMKSDENNNHVSNIDSILIVFKGHIDTKKPFFGVLNYVPTKHTSQYNKLIKSEGSNLKYKINKKIYKFPVFQDRLNVRTSKYNNSLPTITQYNIFDVLSKSQ